MKTIGLLALAIATFLIGYLSIPGPRWKAGDKLCLFEMNATVLSTERYWFVSQRWYRVIVSDGTYTSNAYAKESDLYPCSHK